MIKDVYTEGRVKKTARKKNTEQKNCSKYTGCDTPKYCKTFYCPHDTTANNQNIRIFDLK